MGSITSKIMPHETLLENFMISYLSARGPTPYNMDMIPGGSINHLDEDSVIQHKFKMARKQQKVLREAMGRSISPTRCLSPCMITDFDNDEKLDEKVSYYSYNYEKSPAEKKRSRSKPEGMGRSSTSYQGLGNLRRLVTFGEETTSSDGKKQEIAGGQRRRSRSRPELDLQKTESSSQKSAVSFSSIQSDSSTEAVIEKIELAGKKAKKCWPQREVVRKVLKDMDNRPTTYFLARFRSSSNSEYVETDYRFNQQNGKETFSYKGPSLEDLLSYDERIQYQVDTLNNNLDEKQTFLQNLPYFFNEHEGRIWWNGYLISLDTSDSTRFQISKVIMNPPSLVINMAGVEYVSAARTQGTLTINGTIVKGGDPIKTLQIRGKDADDSKQISLNRDKNKALIVSLPLLSGVPSSSSKLKLCQSHSEGNVDFGEAN